MIDFTLTILAITLSILIIIAVLSFSKNYYDSVSDILGGKQTSLLFGKKIGVWVTIYFTGTGIITTLADKCPGSLSFLFTFATILATVGGATVLYSFTTNINNNLYIDLSNKSKVEKAKYKRNKNEKRRKEGDKRDISDNNKRLKSLHYIDTLESVSDLVYLSAFSFALINTRLWVPLLISVSFAVMSKINAKLEKGMYTFNFLATLIGLILIFVNIDNKAAIIISGLLIVFASIIKLIKYFKNEPSELKPNICANNPLLMVILISVLLFILSVLVGRYNIEILEYASKVFGL